MPYLDKDFKPTVFEYTNVNDYNRLLVYYPRKGGKGVPECDFTYEILVTPTPTPTSSITPTPTPTSSITPTPSITPTLTPTPTPSSSAPAFDADAAAYLADVIASGGTTDATISAATNTLFTSLKSNGLYSKMKVMYPFVGSNASSHAINAKLNKTYDITWSGGLTHDLSGTTGNGTNGYGDTNTNPSLFTSLSAATYGIYQFTKNNATNIEELMFGVFDSNYSNLIATDFTKVNWLFRLGDTADAPSPTANSGNNDGLYITMRTGTTTSEMYRNGNTTPIISYNVGIGGAPYNRSNHIFAIDPLQNQYYSNNGLNFVFIAEGFDITDMTNMSSIINTFQTSLGRNTY